MGDASAASDVRVCAILDISRNPVTGTKVPRSSAEPTEMRPWTEAELEAVREIRERLRAVWSATDRAEAATLVNAILRETATTPYLIKHDALDWHLHMTEPSAPLAHRIGAESAMGLLDLIRTDNLGRLKTCAAEDCSALLVDLSRNSSKRYCDTGNCGNRANVAAYRARRRESSVDPTGT